MVTAEQAKSSYASRVLHLMLLAPEVVAATLTAQQPEGIRRLELLEPLRPAGIRSSLPCAITAFVSRTNSPTCMVLVPRRDSIVLATKETVLSAYVLFQAMTNHADH
jgi:hypothetical protein